MTLFREWQEKQAEKARAKKAAERKENRKTPPERFTTTPQQAEALRALARCTFLPGSYDKRFAHDLVNAPELTIKQGNELARLVYRYRRQLKLSDADAAKWKADLTRKETP